MYSTAISYLKSWDGESSTDSIAASLYHQWKKEILKATLADELTPEQYKSFLTIADCHHFFKKLIFNPASLWWDDKNTILKESQRDIANISFRSMLKTLSKKWGNKMKDWNWGNMHTLEFVHVIGKSKPMNYLFNIGPYPVAGGYSQINNLASKRYDQHFKIKIGPSTRRLIDFKDPSISYGILPTGVSGRVFSKHYKDQTELYINKKYRHQLLNFDDVKKLKLEVMKLHP